MQNPYEDRTRQQSGFDPAISVGVPRAARDAGLRSYMLKVYNYMASGVLLTGIVAMLFANSGMAAQVFFSGGLLAWLIILSPLAIVFAMSFGANRMATSTLQMLFWAFATLMGLSMSTIFLVYTGVSIAQTFFAVTAAFAGLSLWGYTTKKDLSAWGTFLIMGVVGLIVAMVINMFIAATAGTLVPLGLRAMKIDPALASSVFITTLTDVFGFLSFLGLATLFIRFLHGG